MPESNTNKEIEMQNRKQCIYSFFELLNDNTMLIFNSVNNDNDKRIDNFEILDIQKNSVINKCDLSQFELSSNFKTLVLSNKIIIIDGCFYVFSLNGKYIKMIPFPNNVDFDSPIAISNDLTKIAYVNKEETTDEDFYELVLYDVNLSEKNILQKFDNVSEEVPSHYTDFKFSTDDKYLIYSGIKFAKTNSEECYGKIDLNTKKNNIYTCPNRKTNFSENSIYIYDYSPNYGDSSSGSIKIYDCLSDEITNLTLNNKNESQYVRFTKNSDIFITAYIDEKDLSATFTVYKQDKVLNKKTIKFPDQSSFDRTTVYDWKFAYSLSSNKLIYELYTFEENNPDDWGTKELKIVDF